MRILSIKHLRPDNAFDLYIYFFFKIKYSHLKKKLNAIIRNLSNKRFVVFIFFKCLSSIKVSINIPLARIPRKKKKKNSRNSKMRTQKNVRIKFVDRLNEVDLETD